VGAVSPSGLFGCDSRDSMPLMSTERRVSVQLLLHGSSTGLDVPLIQIQNVRSYEQVLKHCGALATASQAPFKEFTFTPSRAKDACASLYSSRRHETI
jgi:hypothetical protein